VAGKRDVESGGGGGRRESWGQRERERERERERARARNAAPSPATTSGGEVYPFGFPRFPPPQSHNTEAKPPLPPPH